MKTWNMNTSQSGSHSQTHIPNTDRFCDFNILSNIQNNYSNGSFKFMFNNNKISNKWKRETNYIYIISEDACKINEKWKKKNVRSPNFRQRPHQFAEQDTQYEDNDHTINAEKRT